MFRNPTILALWAILIAPALASAAPAGSAFSYQGELQDAGVPIDGPVDLRFTLYDSSLGGAATTAALQLDNVAVSQGVLSVELDFGASVFAGDERWLAIEVRNPHDPGDAQPFVLLDPRQPVRPAPYALHALNGGQWESVGGAITNTNPGFVGINRTNQVGAEWFGVHAPVSVGFGGMYVSTEGTAAKPFYGLYTPTNAAWLYLAGSSGDVRLHVDGDRMTWTDTGNVGVGTPAPTEKFQVVGTIHSSSGGFRFPDGSLQTTAAVVGPSGNPSALDASDGIPANAVSVDTSGRVKMVDDLGVGMTTSPAFRLQVLEAVATSNVVHIERDADATSSSDLLELEMGTLSDVGTQFIEAQLASNDVKFRVWADGDVSLDGVVTTGGADFAELVKVTGGASGVEPGDVIVVDPSTRRGFAKSTSAHSTLVAGIHSTKPGILGTETDWDSLEVEGDDGESIARKTLDLAKEHDEIPLAMVGIVPCKVSSENGPVRIGDLLVSADEPGHAMRADNPRAGTILGKALENMDGKTDVITVLVTLQ